VGEEIEFAVLQDATATQAIGDEINDLLRSAWTFERHWRLRAHHLVAGFERLHAVPGVARRFGGIVAAHPVAPERVAQARDLVPVELHAGADRQVIVSERVAVEQAHRVLFRLECLNGAADPGDAGRHHARFRTMSFCQRIDTRTDQSERRLVIVFLLRLDNRDIQAAATSPQDRSHRDTGGAAANNKNLMMLPVRHWLFLPDLFLSARAALN